MKVRYALGNVALGFFTDESYGGSVTESSHDRESIDIEVLLERNTKGKDQSLSNRKAMQPPSASISYFPVTPISVHRK